MTTETTTLHLPTMHCDGCLSTVRSELEKVGASVEESDIETKRVTVRFDAETLTRKELEAAMEMIGFPPEE
jgi:copper chaperone CopZ